MDYNSETGRLIIKGGNIFMDLIIRVIVLGLIPVIVRFILALKIPNSKENKKQNEIILEYNVVSKLIFGICLFVFLLMLIFIVYEASPEEMDLMLFPILLVSLCAFGLLYTSQKIIVNKEEEYFIHRNMFFIKKKYNLKDIECVFEYELTSNIVLLLNNNKKFFAEEFMTNSDEFRSYLHTKRISFKKINSLLVIRKYCKKKKR